MSEKRKILIQLDSDPQPSVFDRVVAIDAGVDELFSYGGVKPEQVQGLVHGAIFTRGPADLKRTAIFVGGSDVAAGERLLAEARKHMLPDFGLRVSILLDANGANTTAPPRAVLPASRHLDLRRRPGPGAWRRPARSASGWHCSWQSKGRKCGRLPGKQAKPPPFARASVPRFPARRLEPAGTGNAEELTCRAGGPCPGSRRRRRRRRTSCHKTARTACPGLKVAVDLNAVPPLGIEGVEVDGQGQGTRWRHLLWRLGVGGVKMKIHRAAIARLFESNDLVLDAEEVYEIAKKLS